MVLTACRSVLRASGQALASKQTAGIWLSPHECFILARSTPRSIADAWSMAFNELLRDNAKQFSEQE